MGSGRAAGTGPCSTSSSLTSRTRAEKARAWERLGEDVPYDRQAYTERLLRAIESLLAPVGVDRGMLETWLLGNVGYWGPPGILPPPGVDGRAPLLARTGRIRPKSNRLLGQQPLDKLPAAPRSQPTPLVRSGA